MTPSMTAVSVGGDGGRWVDGGGPDGVSAPAAAGCRGMLANECMPSCTARFSNSIAAA